MLHRRDGCVGRRLLIALIQGAFYKGKHLACYVLIETYSLIAVPPDALPPGYSPSAVRSSIYYSEVSGNSQLFDKLQAFTSKITSKINKLRGKKTISSTSSSTAPIIFLIHPCFTKITTNVIIIAEKISAITLSILMSRLLLNFHLL